MVSIIIFGIGETYKLRRHWLNENREWIKITAFLDNNSEVQGKKVDGIVVYAPQEIKRIFFDGIVILSQKFGQEMTEQLLNLGINHEKIWNFCTLKLTALRGKRTLYSGRKSICDTSKGKILVITTEMGFNGGTMVAVYAAQALQNRGYEVMLSAPFVNEKLLEEIVQQGLDVTIWDCLPYIFPEDNEWISYYDAVLVNVFQMMNCAYEISKVKPVLWWVHEDRSIWKSFYQDTQKEFSVIDTSEWMDRLDVLGVSNIAKEAFNYFYPSVADRILPFGIPDRYTLSDEVRSPKDIHYGVHPGDEKCDAEVSYTSKIIFAVTAGFSIYKGQRVLVEAIKKLTSQEKKMIEIWFIGPSGENKRMLEAICDEKDNMKFLGLLSHEEIIGILPQIDVLVCPSLIETMSMSTIEGMMFERLCITTDMTGIAEYIEDGINGFIVKAGDSEQLAKRISWIIHNKDEWNPIKKKARETFETEFGLDKMGERLEKELNRCRENFYENTINVSATIS